MIQSAERPKSILDLDKDLIEWDGVFFDADSYARHYTPPNQAEDTPPGGAVPETPAHEPHGVFPADPVHVGWYEAAADQPVYPIMGGCMTIPAGIPQQTVEELLVVRDVHTVETRIVTRPCGSGSGSYSTSYFTSYTTSGSFVTSGSWRLAGGSLAYFGSGPLYGGYGLELI